MNSNELTSSELSQLTQGAECHIHTHPKEVLGFTERLELMQATPVLPVSGDYSPTNDTEILMVDTTSGDIRITLPVANKGREFQIVKIAGANSVIVIPSGSDTVVGSSTGVIFSGLYTSLHFKGILGTGYILL